MKEKRYLEKKVKIAGERARLSKERTELASARTQLASERTLMASERTLLAYFRTSLALFGLAAVVLKFMPEYMLIAVVSLVGGLGLLLYGSRKFAVVRNKLNGNSNGIRKAF